MKPFVFDANVMNTFQKERLLGQLGPCTNAINLAVAAGFIALDQDGQCQNEWVECAGGSHPIALADWIADMLAKEAIQLFPYNCDSMFRELSQLGLAKKDHKWVRLARSSESNNITTDDIDLFSPKDKGCSAKRAQAIKDRCSGSLAKYLKKKYDIVVITPQRFDEIL